MGMPSQSRFLHALHSQASPGLIAGHDGPSTAGDLTSTVVSIILALRNFFSRALILIVKF
jgi:hypothetical protein